MAAVWRGVGLGQKLKLRIQLGLPVSSGRRWGEVRTEELKKKEVEG